MSAWIVSKNQIDVLVTAALAWELIVQEQADEKGRMLWKECQASVAFRYPRDGEGEWPGPWDLDKQRPGPPGLTVADIEAYEFTPIEGVIDPETVQWAALSLSHQSNEHPGWEGSGACRLCEQLLKTSERLVPDHRRRYGEAPESGIAHGEHGAWSADSPRIFLAAMELRDRGRADARAGNQQDVARLRRAGL